jgi:radical SAM superfamily enzyme YgiQ (UPF0313 family)
MRVCLISPPTVGEFTEQHVRESEALRLISEHAPLGILSLAGVLAGRGAPPHILDLNRLYYDYVRPGQHRRAGEDFVAHVVRHLEPMKYDVFGFSSICSTYPMTLRIAEGVRRIHPGATIILGGPQASVVDVPTLRAFPSIDFVLRGEAEETLPLLLDALSGGRTRWPHIGGLTRRVGGEVVRNPNAPVIADLDGLPMPAYDLYPHIRDCTYAPLEAGRGCPFACSFCSTNDFFRRRFRLKSPAVLVGQMRFMKERYGISNFDLVHDMFTVDRQKVLAFCDAVEESGERFYWGCSARTDCVDDELIGRMARAGCIGVFFGIDSGSDSTQAAINKRLDLSEAASMVARTARRRIKTVVSLIAGFPDETTEDLRGTVRFFGDSLRHRTTEVQFHLLAPLAETPITTRFQEQLVYDDISSDISGAGWEQDPADRELVVAHRDIFTNFYAVPTRWLDRRHLMELREFLLRGAAKHRWLLLLLHRDASDLLRVFDEWVGWRVSTRGEAPAGARGREYYTGESFTRDLLDFTRTRYLKSAARHPHLVSTLADVEDALFTLQGGPPDARPRRRRRVYGVEAVPVVGEGISLVGVGADYKRLIRCLTRGERLERVPAGQFTLMLRRVGGGVRVSQLNALTSQLLRSCDGSRSLIEVCRSFSAEEKIDGIPAAKVGLYGLDSLLRRGLVEIKETGSATAPSCAAGARGPAAEGNPAA